MNLSLRTQLSHLLGTLAFFLLSIAGLSAQEPAVIINSLGNNEYRFETTTLDPADKVFYRFHDGFDLTAISTAANPNAGVNRKFKSGEIKVSAFVARKSGPIGIATNTGPTVTCPSCLVPYTGLSSNEYVRIKGTSWSPFIDPSDPDLLLDDKTIPNNITPDKPWFVLNVTLRAPSNNSYATLLIPQNMTVRGAIVNDIYRPISIGPNPIAVGHPNVSSFQHPNSNLFRVNMPTLTGVEFNIYLIVESSTVLGASSMFTAQTYNQSGTPVGPSSSTKLTTRTNPHDPNVLTAFEPSICFNVMNQNPRHYRVDFLNEGAGIADNVGVRVAIDPKIFDLSSIHNITSSSPVTWSVVNNELVFFFQGINLQGLDQDPQPPLDAASGWVEFAVEVKDCVGPGMSQYIESIAYVTFYNTANNFEDTQATKHAKQSITDCFSEGEQCPDGRSATQTEYLNGWVNCYPSLVQDQLVVKTDVSETTADLQIQILELSGKLVFNQAYPVEQGQFFETTIASDGLTPGMYFVQITRGNQQNVFKVIKQ